jgi:hypothetical protein
MVQLMALVTIKKPQGRMSVCATFAMLRT